MKKIILILLLVTAYLHAFSTTWQVVNSGYTFSPATLTIAQGDNVNFILESMHNAVEVSQSVWNANGNSPVIGFSLPYGGGLVSASALTLGTHYYVCAPHASLGMKGEIIVQATTAVNDPNIENDILVYPSPAIDHLNVQFNFPASTDFEIKLFDIQGKLIKNLFPKTQVAGAFLQSFDISKETVPGVYIVKMTVGEKNTFKKVVVL